MTNALLVIDVQNDFCEGGSLAVAGGEQVAKDIAWHLQWMSLQYHHIVTTQDWHINPGDHFSNTPDYIDTWPPHCIALTAGASIHEALPGSSVVDEFFLKGAYSAAYSGFEGLGCKSQYLLAEWLEKREVTHVDICGIATDYCVKATALDAVKLGFSATLLLPLTAAVTPEGGQAAIDEMKAAGVEIYGESNEATDR